MGATRELKFIVSITLGNDAMLTHGDVAGALQNIALRLTDTYGEEVDMFNGQGGYVRDLNGHRVGKWGVQSEIPD